MIDNLIDMIALEPIDQIVHLLLSHLGIFTLEFDGLHVGLKSFESRVRVGRER